MAEQQNCLRIDPVRKQQASPKEKEIAQDKLVEVLQGYIQSEGTIEKPDLVGFAVSGSGAERGSSSSEGEEHFVQLSKAPRKASRVTQKVEMPLDTPKEEKKNRMQLTTTMSR